MNANYAEICRVGNLETDFAKIKKKNRFTKDIA